MKKLSFEVNKRVLQLIQQYIQFQSSNDYPSRDRIQAYITNGTVKFAIREPQPIGVPTPVTPSFVELPSRIYKKLESPRDFSRQFTKYRTSPLFNCDSERLATFHTGSLDEKNSKYYLKVYNKPDTLQGSYHQFDISYAHISGSGSSYQVDKYTNLRPDKSIYRKYLLDCFDKTDGKFPFKNEKNGDYFYVVHFNRDLFKERIDPGNLQIYLAPLTSAATQSYNTGSNFYPNTSSNILFSLIDDSYDADESVTVNTNGYMREYYNIVSGSINDGIYDDPSADAWGVIFPRKGIMILDGVVLDQSCSFNTVTASLDGDNIRKFFVSMSGSCNITAGRQYSGSWYGRASELVKTETYFCRVGQNEFNYSSNYTYTDSVDRRLIHAQFVDNPKTYITTIGLYNEFRELIAVGKLPKPILKTSSNEHLFQVRVRLL
jgi:hypothetical protein